MEQEPKDAPRPQQQQQQNEKPRQAGPRDKRPTQQSGGTSGSGQMQSTQFTDWASI